MGDISFVNDVEKSKNCGAIYQKQCSSCGNTAKYCCPKCSALSCSLQCVKSHKTANSCDGARDPTAFVPSEQFKEKHLQSDLHFMEDVNRKIDNASRAKVGLGRLYFKPIHLDRLRRVAFQRKTRLEILPIVFSKRKISTTYLRYSDNKIFWRVEWSFPLCNISYTDERIDEEESLGYCLDKYLLPNKSFEKDEKLEYYHSMGHNGIVVLLKDEATPSDQLRYHILKQSRSLRVNFRNKRIIEFPTLIVVPKIHLSAYALVGE